MSTTSDNLDWLAFRYIANELEGSELVEFEQRLATDQELREAVARTVELASHVKAAYAVEMPVLAAAQTNWSRGVARWLVVGIGSCLVLFVAVLGWRKPEGRAPQVGAPIARADADLAYAWVQMRQQANESAESHSEDLLAALLEMPLEQDDLLAGDEGLVAPSWMLAAVVRMRSDSDSDMGIEE